MSTTHAKAKKEDLEPSTDFYNVIRRKATMKRGVQWTLTNRLTNEDLDEGPQPSALHLRRQRSKIGQQLFDETAVNDFEGRNIVQTEDAGHLLQVRHVRALHSNEQIIIVITGIHRDRQIDYEPHKGKRQGHPSP